MLGYHIFVTPPQKSIPVIEGYEAPSRTYVAPQGDKTVQKIYDLDQREERPIVEKILPVQDQPDVLSNAVPEETSKQNTASVPPKAETLQPPAAAQSEPEDLETALEETPSKPVDSGKVLAESVQKVERTPQPVPPALVKQAPSRRIQVGPIFNDLTRAKTFLTQLQHKAKGYSFALQGRETPQGTRYRIVTQHALTPSQIQALTRLIGQDTRIKP